jgi:SAM-dependent methyltransferase
MQVHNPIRAFYESNPHMVSSPFGGVKGFDFALLESLFQELEVPAPGSLLDVGCGRGFLRDWVIAQGGCYTGLDFVVSNHTPRMTQGSAQALPFRNASFDLVCCVDAFEHFPEPALAATEFYRVLRPGGTFFLSVPNYGNVAGLVKWWAERSGRYAPRTWAPFGRWQPQEFEQPITAGFIRRCFQPAGFRDLRALGFAREVELGLFPWIDHPAMPEALRFRLQSLFRAAGPVFVKLCPSASLHLFWRMHKPA